jgi:hypothetical protein
LLKTQYRENGAIIYRKHIFILLRRTWVHLSVLTLTSIGFFMGSYQYFSANNYSGGLLALISFTVGVLFVLVLLYHIVDWGNDIYKVTDRHIFDIDRRSIRLQIAIFLILIAVPLATRAVNQPLSKGFSTPVLSKRF